MSNTLIVYHTELGGFRTKADTFSKKSHVDFVEQKKCEIDGKYERRRDKMMARKQREQTHASLIPIIRQILVGRCVAWLLHGSLGHFELRPDLVLFRLFLLVSRRRRLGQF